MKKSELAQAVGLVFTLPEVARKVPVAYASDIEWLTEHKCLLALTTADNERVWPAFQLMVGWPRPSLSPLLWTFAKIDPDPWTLAAWLNTPQERLGGRTPAQSVNVNEVLQSANETIANWGA